MAITDPEYDPQDDAAKGYLEWVAYMREQYLKQKQASDDELREGSVSSGSESSE